MQSIIATIKPGDSGSIVANLQDALFALLEHQIIRALDAPSQPTLEVLQELAGILKKEREQSIFGKATQQLITYFQIQQSLGDHLFGVVEKTTAAKLNEYLEKLDLLKNDSNFIVKGRVFDTEDGKAVADVMVRAFDWYKEVYTFLGEASTDQKGLYQIEFLETAFKNIASDRKNPNLIVRIYDQKNKQIGQSKQVDQAERITELNVEVNTSPFRVYGFVFDSTGKPVQNANVKAFDRDLRWEELLGVIQTVESGFFEIKYSPKQFQRSEKGLADLIVRAYDEQNNELISSGIIFNAAPETEVNLSLPGGDPRGPSEFDNLVREITPLLRDVPQHDLTEDDIAFLSADTGIDRRNILWLAESARRFIEAATIDQFIFYGLFRQNLPIELDNLLEYELSALRDALEKSSQEHVIKYLSNEEMDAIMTKLRALQADHATSPSDAGDPSSLGDLLRTVLSDKGEIRAVAQLYIAHKSRESDDFFAELTALKQFNNQELIDIRLTLQLGELSGIYLPLVGELQRMAKTDPLYEPTGNLSPYVRLSLDDWKAVLHRKQPNGTIIGAPSTISGEDAEEKILNYALILTQQLEGAFPETTIVRRIEADTGDDSPFKDVHTDLMTFFGKNPNFDLSLQPIDIYLSSEADTKLSGIKDIDQFTATLKGIQRISKLTPDYTTIRTLMTNGLLSAKAVVDVGQYYFIQQYYPILGGKEKALLCYRNAKHIQNTAMAVYMKNSPAFRSPLPYVLGGQAVTEPRTPTHDAISFRSSEMIAETEASSSSWTKLFGSLEMCECRHCRSLYSPAAYLVDTLNFISDAPVRCQTTPLNNLLKRRPDIEHIELTCDNTNTRIPYVDLVNEILETSIAPREFEVIGASGVLVNLNKEIIDTRLINDFVNQGYTLTEKASVRIDLPDKKWTILDTSWAFVLTHPPGSAKLNVSAWPQTSWSEKELKANPEHTHIDAYDKLRKAVYPWRLPFNLPIEEARVYFQHLVVHRHEVLSVFMRGSLSLPDPESDNQVAYEYLGLSPEEALIINGNTTGGPLSANPGPWDFWGLSEDNNDISDPADSSMENARGLWIEVLKRISIFLYRSNLSYRELLDLLETNYINPRNDAGPNGRSIAIVAADLSKPMTCNTAKLALYAIGDNSQEYVSAYTKAHRFVRLARKLGWALRDLDRAITALQPLDQNGKLDITNNFLVQLSHIQRLSLRKNVPVVNLLSFWADIDHMSYIDHVTDGEPVVPSLYAQMFISKTLESTGFPTDPEELGNQRISDYIAAIAAAYGIGADDVDRLRADNLVILDDRLTLDNLSRLYRHSLLAQLVGLPIRQYLTALRLITADPFARVPPKLNTAKTLDFVKAVDHIASSGFSIDDLDYLLRHTSGSTSVLAITDAEIGAALNLIRSDLRQIAVENTFVAVASDGNVATTDPDGNLTRQKLALLNWSEFEIDTVIAVLNNTYLFEAELASLDTAIRLPSALSDRIRYDATAQRLQFKGVMSSADKTLLVAAPNNTDQSFKDAVDILYNGPRNFFERQMRRFSVQVFKSDLPAMPPGLVFPNTLKNKVYYDNAANKLCCIGVMTEVEKNILIKLSADRNYRDAIGHLFAGPEVLPVEDSDRFLIGNEMDSIFDDSNAKPAQRFALVLSRLLLHLRTTLSERMVKQRLSEHTRFDVNIVDGLLNMWVRGVPETAGTSRPLAMTVFVNPIFTDSNPNLQIDRTTFPQQFMTYLLLHKIAAVIGKFAFNLDLVRTVFERGTARDWLDFNQLPLTPVNHGYALFPSWSRLADMARLRDTLPNGVSSISDWMAVTFTPGTLLDKALEKLGLIMKWNLVDLQSLGSINGFNLALDALHSEATLWRLADAMALLKRLRASADQCLAWTQSVTGDDVHTRNRAQSQDIKNLVRAKYQSTQWLELAGALRDPLREKQRSALTDYLVTTWHLKDATALYAELLIDVEMSPCMITTTRIKQAISSVQMYVQRTLMNLEECAELDNDQAKQWGAWRKQYRVWEANRNVLLYPENWIEPELRDDKTPFFKDLENELLQNDITTDIAEDAFINYLEKLDQVARLDIVGMYEDKDSDKNILHVIGRTVAVPHIYFYRRLENTVWTPWEKVELDIEGDHLIPVVWNRHLYLFWAIFTEKSEQPTKAQRDNNEDPVKNWEIKLAWSKYKHKGWSPKKLCGTPLKVRADESVSGQQAIMKFAFKTRIIEKIGDSFSLSIECFGPFVCDPLPVSTPNNQPLPSPKMHLLNPFIRAQGFYFFKVNGYSLDAGVKSEAKVEARYAGGRGIETFGLTDAGAVTITPGTKGVPLVFLKLDGYEVIDQKMDHDNVLSTRFTVDLKPTTAPTPTSTPKSTPIVEELKCLGEFRLDDCNDQLMVGLSGEFGDVSSSYLRPLLSGTAIQGMEVVEESSSAGALGATKILLQTAGNPFKLLFNPKYRSVSPVIRDASTSLEIMRPFFFKDEKKTYFIAIQTNQVNGNDRIKLRFWTFFHPLVCKLLSSLKQYGMDGMLTLDNQKLTDDGSGFDEYEPNARWVIITPRQDAVPIEDIDFRYEGAYSQYNWELFFHAPFLIATQLSKNQRFEEAQKWFHYIFNPTSTVSSIQGPERFWKVLPFFDEAKRGVQTLEELLADSANIEQQVRESAAKPFNPHAIARMRIMAYMKTVVMHYIDNLIAWGDQLFGRDTIESINEATLLYILAAEILGKRPESIPPRITAKVQTYSTLYDSNGPDSLSNALVEVEGYIFPSAPVPVSNSGTESELPLVPYFCISPNDKLLGYWNIVAERLFNIRHCRNLAGVERTLPIDEPPIDPALLVRAAAAGVDLSSALSDINAAAPHFRFGVMQPKAAELCNDLKSLGNALLSALEKRDAEAMALLRSSQEIDVLKAVRQIKEQQIKEASAALEGLNEFQQVVTARQQYYQSREFVNPFEIGYLGLTTSSLIPMSAQLGAEVVAAILHLIPNTKAGAPTTAGLTYGGANIAAGVQAFGSAAGITASMVNTKASLSATLGNYQRRQEDWTHQADLATKELKQVEKQIVAAEIRLAIAEHELQNHDLQIENSKNVDAFMRDKFTNRELYNWMVGQLSAVYFQSYQLAYDVAKRAERAYRFELGLRDSNFIQFGYWDSLKKGLLSGERLYYDLKRMDVAYLDQNRREHEIVKHISLAALDPMALVKLKKSQSCFISLPEVLFDLDHPGHYLRRIKSVSVTIPCVTGPYAGVHCTLTLLNSTVRHSNMLLANGYDRQSDDVRFTDSIGAIQSIVTSSGQNDSGLFETNLRDERYLPFEGAGAISEWRLQLPTDFRQFNYETISDVILHVRYTARDGGETLADRARIKVQARLNALRQLTDGDTGLVQMLSLRNEYPTEWNQLRSGADGTTQIILNKARFPYLVSAQTINLIHFSALARVPATTITLGAFSLRLTKKSGSTASPTATADLGFQAKPPTNDLGDWRISGQSGIQPTNPTVSVSNDAQDAEWTLTLMVDDGTLDAQHRKLLEDVVLLVGYQIATPS